MKNKKNLLYFALSTIIILSFYNFRAFALPNPDYTIQIDAGSYWALYNDLSDGDTWSIEFEVTAGGNKDITVYVLDEEDYNNFAAELSFSYYKYYEKYQSGSFDFTAPSFDTYYIVFDNSFSILTAKTVEINSQISYYVGGGGGNGGGGGKIPGYNFIIIIGITIGISLILTKKIKSK